MAPTAVIPCEYYFYSLDSEEKFILHRPAQGVLQFIKRQCQSDQVRERLAVSPPPIQQGRQDAQIFIDDDGCQDLEGKAIGLPQHTTPRAPILLQRSDPLV